MRRNEYTSDRKMRSIFEIDKVELIAAKIGEQDFDLEDMRFCLDCSRWYDANYWISQIDFGGDIAFVCERCADQFDAETDGYKHWRMDVIETNYRFHKDALKCARIERDTK